LQHACGRCIAFQEVTTLLGSEQWVNRLSGNNRNERHSPSRTDAIIGADMRVEGNVTFTGVLHVQGEVIGDISCDTDSSGTLVVDKPGNVTGTIKAPHIIVSGRIAGPVHSSESIEIQQGAYIAGDAIYKTIDIHPGGVIEGSLIPGIATGGELIEPERDMKNPEPPSFSEYGSPAAAPARGRRLIGGAVAVLVAVAAIALLKRESAPVAAPEADVALKTDSSSPAAPPPPAAIGPQENPKAVAEETPPAVPGTNTDTRSGAQASPAESEANPANVVLVQGVNPAKSAGVILLISRESAVLFKKKRQDSGEGTRIDTSQGATESIAIARNEILRVASGQDLQIFYQGRKVAPRIIASGAWMSFVPLSSEGESDKK
jgi:cytoskeletal protein CcmA (bactofilin family)